MSETKFVVPGAGYSTMAPPKTQSLGDFLRSHPDAKVKVKPKTPFKDPLPAKPIPKLRAGPSRSVESRVHHHIKHAIGPVLKQLWLESKDREGHVEEEWTHLDKLIMQTLDVLEDS